MPKELIDKFKDQYGERGEQIYYATMNKQGRDPKTGKKKSNENSDETPIQTETMKNKLKKIIKEAIKECIKEYAVDGAYGSGGIVSDLSPMMNEDYVHGFISEDYSSITGFNTRLKECGCNTKINYVDGKHELQIFKEHLPLAINVLENSADDLGRNIAEKINKRYFNKK